MIFCIFDLDTVVLVLILLGRKGLWITTQNVHIQKRRGVGCLKKVGLGQIPQEYHIQLLGYSLKCS